MRRRKHLCIQRKYNRSKNRNHKSQTEESKEEETSSLSGSVSTNGSTSMEKVIGILSEEFMAKNPDVGVTYDPTGSGTGIEAASNGSQTSVFPPVL